jgi:UDP-N-acetylmuramoylalanine--D-glutamate ligase
MNLKGKRISIIGAGRSGLATAKVVSSLEALPFISDNSLLKDESLLGELSSLNAPNELGGHTSRVFDCDLMVVSPGVPSDSEVIVTAKEKGVAVWPEIELAYKLCRGKIVGITGSNGKTTTTALIGEIFKNAGIPAFVCGNIGNPFIAIALQVPENGYAVVELSSFQLEQIDSFKPDIAVFLNLTPDHLDRHRDLDAYIDAKMRIFENQTASEVAVINFDDQVLRRRCPSIKSHLKWFSLQKRLDDGIWAIPGESVFDGETEFMKTGDIKIRGEHNLSNACAAIGAAVSAGISTDKVVETLKSFAGVEHRLEPVRLIGGVSYINDSKGTNVDSVFWALKAVSAPVILIAGGKDKGGDFSALNEIISQKVKLVILIGQAADKIEAAWSRLTRIIRAGTMEKAVIMARDNSQSGDTILLSPGCASFDMFDNYEHRGRVFKQAVWDLKTEGAVR